MATKKYFTDESLSTLIDEIKTSDAESLSSAKSYTDTKLSDKANSSHTHDDRYYTESEIDTKISGVNSTISTHTGNTTAHITSDERTNWNAAYSHSTSTHAPSNAERNVIVGIQKNGTDLTVDSSTRKVNIIVPTTAAEIGAATSGHNHDSTYDAKGAAADALADAKAYTDTKTSGFATTSSVTSAISSHNTSTTAHSDIRDLISALSTKVNNFLDVDDATTDELSEILELINNNKGTLESLTSSKVNVSDIVNNLTTASTTKVLSANQGVVLKGLIDSLQETVDGKANSSHSHTITATATDDDVIVLTGTNGSNKVTFDAKHAASGVTAGTYKSVTVNTYGHVTGGSNPTTLSGYGITDAYTKTQVDSIANGKAANSHNHSAATTSTAGFMSAEDKTKLDGIATGATKITVDSSLSTSSTNPVRNSVVTTAINSATSAISANTNSISTHTSAIAALQSEIDSYEEITSDEISALFA